MNKILVLLLLSFTTNVWGQNVASPPIHSFIPAGFAAHDTVPGDLNKDGLQDLVLIIKATRPEGMVTNRFGEQVDRNRRGIIVLLREDDHYRLAAENHDCFASENEDGGIYFPPSMSVEIAKGNLYVHYAYGRYGFWRYTFRYQQGDFELIGYDESRGGAVTESEISINFSTRRKFTRTNTNVEAEGGDEVFEDKWEDIKLGSLLRLSEIQSFQELDMSQY